MIRRLSIITILLAFLISCGTFQGKRGLASIDQYQEHEGVLTISNIQIEDEKHGIDRVQNIASKYNQISLKGDGWNEYRTYQVELFPTDSLPAGEAFALDTDVTEDGRHLIKVFVNKNEGIGELAVEQLDGVLRKIYSNKIFITPMSFFELVFNAKNGHTESKIHLQTVKKMAIESIREEIDGEQLEEAEKSVNETLSALEEVKKTERKSQIAAEKARKEKMKIMDKFGADGQLRTLIQKNDRHGVADLLESYLPREYFTPMEHRYWNFVLEKIKNPAPLKDRVIMYRGTSGDRLVPMIKNGKEIPYEEAVAEGKLVAMSTMMTRNQGTWNRRLRSLQTMYGKEFSTNPNKLDSEFASTQRITTWMKRHSQSPEGSPFLSFSSEFSVSLTFGRESIGAFLVDPEMILFNQMSGYSNEMEYLHLLMTFPDEMVSYYDREVDGDFSDAEIKKRMNEGIERAIKNEYGEQAEEVLMLVNDRSKLFKDKASAYLIPQFEKVKVKKERPVKMGFFRRLWYRIFKKDAPVYETYYEYEKKAVKIKNHNNCMYLIKSFN